MRSALVLPAVVACLWASGVAVAAEHQAPDRPESSLPAQEALATQSSPGSSEGLRLGSPPSERDVFLRKAAAEPESTVSAPPNETQLKNLDPTWEPLIQRLADDGFNKTSMRLLFSRMGPNSFTSAYMAAKVLELYGVGGGGIKRDGQLAPVLPENRPSPPERLNVGACKALISAYADVFADIEKKHGVPAQDIVAILLVETGLGGDLGDNTALRVLASMAAVDSPEKLALGGNSRQPARLNRTRLQVTLTEKSNWAYNELKSLILYSDKLDIDAATLPASMYGAVGVCQFMPSKIDEFGCDGNNDGVIDLFTLPDAFYSVARYLEAAGRRTATTRQARQAVFYAYNHDNGYASGVLEASERIERGLAGKLGDSADPLAGFYLSGPRVLDPSLRGRSRYIPPKARLTLESYDGAAE